MILNQLKKKKEKKPQEWQPILAIQDEWCACDYKHVAVLTSHLIPPGWLRIVTQIE